MPTPNFGTPIKMSDVQNETNLTPNMFNFFSSSQIGGLGGLMYHNLGMGVTGNATAKQEIYNPFVAGPTGGPVNLSLGAWYSYSQTPNMVFDIFITNNSVNYDVTTDVYIYDPSSATAYGINGNPFTTVNTNGSDVTLPDYDTGVVANTTNFANGYYQINLTINITYIGVLLPEPGLGNATPNTLTSSDTDGAGPPGTVRNSVNIPAMFSPGNPFNYASAITGNIAGNNIYVNKRTTFTLTFND